MQKKNLLKSPIAKGISLALGASMMSPIYADEAEDATDVEQVEEQYEDEGTIVITGIRGSLMKSMDTKRLSNGVVDAINSEDIGKFPDTNLAESLQRITGVSIDRSRGEGSRVTVRGFGADFNLVTLNGRQMPTNSGAGRSFDFGDLASEGVAGVEIYKTGRASVPTGGIGATINIKSARPLDSPGLNMGFGVKAVNDTSTREGDTFTPEFSGIYSDTFFDDTFGIALSASVQERNNGQASINTNWTEQLEVDGGTIADTPNITNLPSAGDIVAKPQSIGFALDEWERTRINSQLALQFKPVDEFQITLDYTYAELELDHRYNNVSYWFTPSMRSATFSDGPIVTPLIYSEFGEQVDTPMGGGIDATRNELKSAGINFRWDVNDRLRLTLDHHDSENGTEPNSPYGSGALITIASFERAGQIADWTRFAPNVEAFTNKPLSPFDMGITGSQFNYFRAKMEVEQTQFSGKFEIDEISSIDFGVAQTKIDNGFVGSLVERGTWNDARASALGTIADLLTPASFAGVFDNMPGGELINNQFFMFDMAAIAARGEFLQNLDPSDTSYLAPAPNENRGTCGTGFCPDIEPGFGDQFVEETTSAYIQYNTTGEIGEYPFNLIVGVRWEETDTTSSAESALYNNAIEWNTPNEFDIVPTGDTAPSGLTGNYDYVLPSLDFDMELRDDMVARFSYSETIARADFNSLRGNLNVNTRFRYIADGSSPLPTASVGNPGLLPHEAKNFDLSYEWYYEDASYFSVGYFRKNVKNFVVGSTLRGVDLFPEFASPALGPLYQDAVAALGTGASNEEIRNWIFDNRPTAPGVDVANNSITGVTGRDAAPLFEVTTQGNNPDETTIDGFEIAWQHDFLDTGFGFIANMTLADGDAVFDPFLNENQFALTGLSDTRNLILYYDRDGIQVRIAYNWRDEFLAGGSGSNRPGYTSEYEQVDINASYDIDGAWSVFFEGINVLNENNRSHFRSYNQPGFVGQTGPRYNLGVRYTY